MSEGSSTPRHASDDEERSGPPEEQDAVARVRSWLVERGVDLPEHEPIARIPVDVPGRRRAAAPPAAPRDETGAARRGGAGAGLRGAADADEHAPNADHESVARTIVLRKLAAQARTRAELSKALSSRQVPEEAAEAVLDRMEEVGLVDDAEFARDWVRSRQQRRHLSRTVLRRELSGKGVDRDQIDAALEQVDAGDELRAARSLAAKKERSTAGLEPEVRRRRLAGMLGRRGFSPGVISQVLAEGAQEVQGESLA
ncbi:MAG TPA: regulatory protein RecX [Propionibacteriaceae bacterium]